MTLGLAVADNEGIYMAIESKGLSLIPSLKSKLIELQTFPQIMALLAGGLSHWEYVINHYVKQNNVMYATREIMELLDANMNEKNQAYGLLCCYDGSAPICYRINRSIGFKKTEYIKEDINRIQIIGRYEVAIKALNIAQQKIYLSANILDSLVQAIESCYESAYVELPVDKYMIIK